jgi:hypothetical protein
MAELFGVNIPAISKHLRNFGFEPTRKLPGINDRKQLNIRNMDPFAIVESRGFGGVQIPSLWSHVVYTQPKINLTALGESLLDR